MAKSIGEQRVRTEFNPSNTGNVDSLKQRSAQLINDVRATRDATTDPEVHRLCDLAEEAYELGAMWAVKAATAGK